MNILKTVLSGIPIGFINGFFGSGGGVAAVYVLEKILKTDAKKSHATAIGIILPLSIASLFMYGTKALADTRTVVLCSVGGCIGGAVGAKILGKIPKKWLKILFGGVMVISGARLIL